MAATRRMRRPRRGRPAKMAPPPLESGDRLVVEAAALAHPAEAQGGTVRATTVRPEGWADGAMLQAYHHPKTTVEPGFRWLKHPAALAPVWLETPERSAALARLTVVGVLVYRVLQRQVRLSLDTPAQPLPGNKGLTAPPTAAVVLAVFAPGALVRWWSDAQAVVPLSGVQSQHRLGCDALGLDSSWSAGP